MTVHATLNNYQLGSYAHKCLGAFIKYESRINAHHTKVVWDLQTNSQKEMLQKALGSVKLFDGEESY